MKKIQILCLHLSYGGIEVAISNLANMLCDDYNVEILSLYKAPVSPVYYINDKVTIKYLINDISNKKEFKDSLKHLKIIKTFKEGIKSTKILYLKNKKLKEEIKKLDGDIIISTRVEFTELLSKLYKGNAITISQDHTHHNNDSKHINRVVNSLKNIDYYMPVSKKLTKFYKNKIQDTKVMYGPLCLDYLPEKEAKKNNKNIVSIGRLSKEKGYVNLIEVFKLIHDEDEETRLHIIGDGIEKDSIKKKINELNLKDYVTLYGFRDKDFIHEKLYDMSLYLMTSFEESFGLVLLEASSYSIPCIAFSSAEGACEIIRNDVDGYLINDRNFEEMKNKSIELLNNKKKLSTMGHEARNKSMEYSYDIVKGKWIGILNDIINSKNV